eukprot:2890636-Rhodomonas_salina.7
MPGCRWLNKRKGEIIEHDVLPCGVADRGVCRFPVWELQVFLITFTGVAESTGIAIASGCRAYEILGEAPQRTRSDSVTDD